MITQIKIPAVWQTWDHTNENRYERFEVAEFNTGPGPCGKEVVSLGICYGHKDFVRVIQRCSDGSSQDFYYRTVDIRGRIEVYND